MPYVRVSTNIKRASVNVESTLQAFNKMLSDAFEVPQIYVMAHIDFDQDMQLNNTKQPCAFVDVRMKGKINAKLNPNTVVSITAVVTAALGIRADHVFINLNDIIGDNWGYDGNVLPN